ncbi:thiol:disulfide interchange protein [Acinetobacter sp. KAM398]|nr:thiol:disulfide interchange protein [Acinetobacter sp. KAM392]GJC34866.1 thiol:disulfide interchange protein [Acinetobacter sp. KAM393]GJC37647.1 thiol:disulfide interchange protein [Acinetobacter sp. KAM394]GJC40514.1 thiol:disulfide interchange protein [Acinetobacter sp. KAM395]GJC43336.1 thiol:disulfide interchange protein [Acinetobacter sp. KAM396]GJC46204.1 thiol:disulfide interchange protein [Acinetobacter sp. KAM397]GJC48944.1 thiol:disulfide interchange protein [Acinetobacter sp. K
MADVATVSKNVKQQHPQLKLDNIQATEMKGIYSASMDGQVVYLNEDAQHILAGSMIRLKDQHNLTKDLLIQQNSVDWKKLPLQDAIKSVRGTGKRQIAIFSDPNCPYCKQLEAELKKLNNITIYTFILPLKAHSVAPSKQVYCEKNPALAWENLITKAQLPTSQSSCANPVERNMALAHRLGVSGTPAIIFSNGFKVMGAYPAAQIEQIFKEFDL